jgi:hypothetical protein
MFMDQAGWHKAGDLVVPPNMRLQWLPPYSPQCKPVEHLWDQIREKWFGSLVFHDMQGVEDTLAASLSELEHDTERIRGVAGFDWIISIPWNAN